ncbi:MAG: hypothetical protein AB7Q00_08790 [Phycisphaerales bacterium]
MREYLFEFKPAFEMRQVEAIMSLAVTAAEGLYNPKDETRPVELLIDREEHSIRVRGEGDLFDTVLNLFVSLGSHEFGRQGFTWKEAPGWRGVRPDHQSRALAEVAQ